MASENERPKMTIWLDEKPKLLGLAMENPKQFQEVMNTFIELATEAVENEWHKLPELFTQGKVKLTFSDLVKGILHGSLDLKNINPEAYPVIFEEVHPLSMLVPRKNEMGEGLRYFNWREWYKLDPNTPVNQETIEVIFRKLLRYYKVVPIDMLGEAINNRQTQNWLGLENPNLVANLPFVPALRYQRQKFGDLEVGKFFDEIGFFDLGNWENGDSTQCPACQHETIQDIGDYVVCLSCNSGFRKENNENANS